MMHDTLSDKLSGNVLVERRRPGRINHTNPFLIALLRSAGRENGPHAAGSDSNPEAFIGDPVLEDAMCASVSVLDGACQIAPHKPSETEQAGLPVAGRPELEFLPDRGCYVAGTNIAAATGMAAVEALTIGDVILTASGRRQIVEIRSFVVEPVSPRDASTGGPVYIRRHALADGVPGQDLWLAPNHCISVDDQLVPASLLVNGLTVLQDPLRDPERYYQVRYAEPVLRQATVNTADLAGLQRRLAQRAARLGHRPPSLIGPDTADLYLTVDGKILLPVEIDGMRRSFVVPRHRSIQLASRFDINVTKIEIVSNEEYRVVPADHPVLLSGWGPAENDGNSIWRRLMGSADLPTIPNAAYAKIVVSLQG